MAHFLEHLVFKGGEKYADYRKVNETAERMGAMLNAYTSHDLVAFHITVPRRGRARGDRPADRLRRPPEDRRRGARPRARRRDPGDRARQRPAVDRRRAPDRPRRVRRPPARAARCSGPAEHLRDTFTRDGDRRLPRAPWARRARRRVPGRQPRAPAGRTARWTSCSAASRRCPSHGAVEPAPPLHAADARRGARLQPVAPAHVLPARDRPARPRAARRADDLRDAARRLDGLAPVRRDPRAARPRLLRLLGRRTRSPTCRSCSCRPGSSRPSASRPTAHARDRRRAARRRARARRRSSAPAPTPPGARVLAFENTNAVARHAAQQTIVFGEEIDPDRAIAALDEVTLRRRRRGRRAASSRRAVGRLRRPAHGRGLRVAAGGSAIAPAPCARVAVRAMPSECRVGPGAQPPRARALRASGSPTAGRSQRALLGGARVADAQRRAAAARARARVRRRARLRALRRRAVARARLPGRLAVGRARDGRARPTCTATRRPSSSASASSCGACARRPSTGSSCSPSLPAERASVDRDHPLDRHARALGDRRRAP